MIMIMFSAEIFKRLEAACGPAEARSVRLQTGETVFRQGAEPPGLPLVLQGQVDLLRWTEAGRSVRIHAARVGETFAEASLYAGQCHCDAVATMPTVVRLLSKRAVLGALETSPELAAAFTEHLAKALMASRRLLELRSITPLTQRLLARLDELADGQGNLPKDIKLMSIAADLNVTAPALYRAIAKLEKHGVLTRPGHGRVRLRRQSDIAVSI